MSRPPFEVADIIRVAGDSFRQRYSASLTWPQYKVLDAIARCRTAALGGHRDACVNCGHQAISYNSCLMGSVYFWGVRAMSREHSKPG
ncbi:MAG TPA: transposase zinc-binding domain-containing protein [Acidobacteriaceae bacterium]|nr:transposase zinc-binding domain-containing protein [Acidobacteriaceae bacterium]